MVDVYWFVTRQLRRCCTARSLCSMDYAGVFRNEALILTAAGGWEPTKRCQVVPVYYSKNPYGAAVGSSRLNTECWGAVRRTTGMTLRARRQPGDLKVTTIRPRCQLVRKCLSSDSTQREDAKRFLSMGSDWIGSDRPSHNKNATATTSDRHCGIIMSCEE